jgi:hypothetical protein
LTARPRRWPALVAALTLSMTAIADLAAGTAATASPHTPPGTSVYGGDISWPNCPRGMGTPERRSQGLPMPTAGARFVVVGLTNGPAFSPNPCLRKQVAWAKARHLWIAAYSVVSYPDSARLARYGGTGPLTRRLQRVGAAQAAFNLNTMRKAGLRVPLVWVDVEHVRGWAWSPDSRNNNALLNGMFAAHTAAGIRNGVYSYRYGWKEITGGRALPGVPVWATSGSNTRASAAARCSSRSFSGGPVLLAQWSDGRRDHNITCPRATRPGRARTMSALFAST